MLRGFGGYQRIFETFVGNDDDGIMVRKFCKLDKESAASIGTELQNHLCVNNMYFKGKKERGQHTFFRDVGMSITA